MCQDTATSEQQAFQSNLTTCNCDKTFHNIQIYVTIQGLNTWESMHYKHISKYWK